MQPPGVRRRAAARRLRLAAALAAALEAGGALAAQLRSSGARRGEPTRGEHQHALRCELRAVLPMTGAFAYGLPYGRLERRYRSCAVVSSSGVLQRHRHGAEIDTAEAVIRFNSAPVGPYGDLVGSREDIRVVNDVFFREYFWSETVKTFSLVPNMTFVVVPHAEPEFIPQFRTKFPGAEIYEVSPSSLLNTTAAVRSMYGDFRFPRGVMHSENATTGAVGMLLAMEVCDEVRAYGMAESSDAGSFPYHYYEVGGSATKSSWHPISLAEKELWRELASNTPEDVDASDVAIIPGFGSSDLACPPPHWKPPPS